MSDNALATAPRIPSPAGDPGTLTGAPENPAAYPVVSDVHPRYSDLGPDGEVGAVALARWFEDARVNADLAGLRRLATDRGLASFRVLLAAQHVERLAPMPGDAEYRIGIGVRRLGRSSFTYAYAVFRGDRCVALGDTVTVFATTGGPTELPDSLREDLAAMALDEPGSPRPADPGEGRRSRSAYPFGIDLRTRVGDIDTNRHVNNVALVSWYADAIAARHLELLGNPTGGPPPALAPTTMQVQYVAEVTYPATYPLGVVVGSVDDNSVGYACGLFRGDECVGLAHARGAGHPAFTKDAIAS